MPDEVSIRKLKDLIGLAALYSDSNILKPEDIESAAGNILFSEDKVKVDYWTCLAIRMSTYSSLLPWMNGKEAIPENIPACLCDIVDKKTGEFDSATLDKRIYELSRMVGV